MSKPSRGDYHLAEVKTMLRKGEVWRYQARCDACGWAGQTRDTLDAAVDDALAHDVTENE